MSRQFPDPHAPTAPDEDVIEAAVWGYVFALHPIQLTLDELIRELVDEPDDFASRDVVLVAVKQLTRTGLLHRHGHFVLPTRTAYGQPS
jgi:hypothetical protein